MDRRAFIGVLASGLLAAPLTAEEQPAGKVYRIGFLSSTGCPIRSNIMGPFRCSSSVTSRARTSPSNAEAHQG